ncbi:MAG: hypothetical protein PVF34_11350 [Gammaproteobacteria bacterium]|jgi:hypothetical protein
MSNTPHSIVVEPLAMEEIRTVVDHMINAKKLAHRNRYILSSDTRETDDSVIHTVVEASVTTLDCDSTDPVHIYETTYIVNKSSGEILQNEKCIEELMPECSNSELYIYS